MLIRKNDSSKIELFRAERIFKHGVGHAKLSFRVELKRIKEIAHLSPERLKSIFWFKDIVWDLKRRLSKN